MAPGQEVPPPAGHLSPRRRWARALLLGQCLGVGSPDSAASLAGRLSSTQGDWTGLAGTATEELLAPSLWVALRDSGLSRHAPIAVGAALEASWRQNMARNLRLRSQLVQAVGQLHHAGIETLVLKGGALLVDGRFGDIGGRVTADLDLLVPAGKRDDAVSSLASVGYRYVSRPARAFAPPPHDIVLTREQEAAPIELHAAVGGMPLPEVVPTDRAWAASIPVRGSRDAPGLRMLCADDHVLHNVLHAQVQDRGHLVGDLPLRQLHTLVLVDRALGHLVDWAAVKTRMEQAGFGDVLRAYLCLAHRVFAFRIPAGLDIDVRARLHGLRAVSYFALGWPCDIERNLRWAFSKEYLGARYGDGGGAGLAAMRLRHALTVAREHRGRGLDLLRRPQAH